MTNHLNPKGMTYDEIKHHGEFEKDEHNKVSGKHHQIKNNNYH